MLLQHGHILALQAVVVVVVIIIIITIITIIIIIIITTPARSGRPKIRCSE